MFTCQLDPNGVTQYQAQSNRCRNILKVFPAPICQFIQNFDIYDAHKNTDFIYVNSKRNFLNEIDNFRAGTN